MSQTASDAVGDAVQYATLVIRSHFRLADKPQSTLEALRVFFPGDANLIFARLRAGPVEVRRGDPRSIRALALSLRAQGFDVDVNRIAPPDGA
jgi:hypothetical protein